LRVKVLQKKPACHCSNVYSYYRKPAQDFKVRSQNFKCFSFENRENWEGLRVKVLQKKPACHCSNVYSYCRKPAQYWES
jgi:hypothetical protein